jgi:hypothetical protein
VLVEDELDDVRTGLVVGFVLAVVFAYGTVVK